MVQQTKGRTRTHLAVVKARSQSWCLRRTLKMLRIRMLFCIILSVTALFPFLVLIHNIQEKSTAFTEQISRINLSGKEDDLNTYLRTKYHQPKNYTRWMNLSLSVAESGALALRVSREAKASLDFRRLRENSLALKEPSRRQRTARLKRAEAGRTKESALRNSSAVKHILYWNKFVQFDNFEFGAGEEAFVRHGCEVSSCTATEDPSLVPEDRVDAVVYSVFLNLDKHITLPLLPRFPNAMRVAFATEAPARLAQSLKVYHRTIDYTITYRYDSDAPRTGRRMLYPKDVPDERYLGQHNFAEGKTKLAAWFVSNCRTPSMRHVLVDQLRREGVTVDVYGACGEMSCSTDNTTACYDMLQRDYKFYLAFENSLCNHYVTEKFYNALNYDVVPVTYGLGHELLGVPKEGYVDVFDFSDVKKVADYLLFLDTNDTEYNKHFRWKRELDVLVVKDPDHPFCKLCADLHADPPLPKKKYDLQAWFSEGQCIDVLSNPRLRHLLNLNDVEHFYDREFSVHDTTLI